MVLPRLVLFGRSVVLFHYDASSFSMQYDGYLAIAQSLVKHGVYGFDGVHSITTRAPLFPLLLVPGVALGFPVVWTFLLQLALSTGAVINTRCAARSLGASERASFLAGAFVALNPWFIMMSPFPTTFVTAVFLVTCLLRFLSRGQYMLLGLSGGLLAVCHPSCALALAGALTADAIRRNWRSVARPIVVALTAYVIVLSPWIVRNYAVTGRFVPGVDGFGYQYLIGSWILKNGPDHGSLSIRPLLPAGHDTILFETVDADANMQLNRIAFRELSDTLIHNPGQILYRCVRQFIWFWIGDRPRRNMGILISAAHLLYLAPLFLGAAKAIWCRWRSAGAIILIIAPTILIHSVVTAFMYDAAYSLTAIPVLAAMTACVGEDLFRRQTQRG